MPKAKIIYKEDIVKAMSATKSNRAAAKWMGISFSHYKKYARLFTDADGVSLYEKHKNPSGKGIPKFFIGSKLKPAIKRIITGHLSASHFTPDQIKHKLIEDKYLEECCDKCKFIERRLVDGKIPLLLNFKDGNKHNYMLANLRLLCYNCFFLTIGDLFTIQQIDLIEDTKKVKNNVKRFIWELDDDLLANMEDLGI